MHWLSKSKEDLKRALFKNHLHVDTDNGRSGSMVVAMKYGHKSSRKTYKSWNEKTRFLGNASTVETAT